MFPSMCFLMENGPLLKRSSACENRPLSKIPLYSLLFSISLGTWIKIALTDGHHYAQTHERMITRHWWLQCSLLFSFGSVYFYVPDEVTRNEGEEARDKSFGFKNLNLGILSYFCGRKFISLYVSGKLPTYSSPKPTLTCFSLRAKCWLSGGVWQFPRNVYMTREFSWKRFSIQMWYIFRLNKACWKLRHKAYYV